MKPIMKWEPVLSGPDRSAALETIEQIAEALTRPPVSWIPDNRAEPYRRKRGITLSTGSAGLVLFFAYHGRVSGTAAWQQPFQTFLEHVGDGLETLTMPAGFMNGLTGIVWALDHASRVADQEIPGLEDVQGAIDAELAGFPLASDGFDLWQGLVGHGVYALERVGDHGPRAIIQSVVEQLEESYGVHESGAPWFTLPEYLSSEGGPTRTEGNVNLGVAHGVAGVVIFLALAHAAGLGSSSTTDLCDRAWNWLAGQEARDDQGAYWPNSIVPGREPVRGLTRWCNGMPGIAAATMTCGRLLAHEDMYRWALERAREIDLFLRHDTSPGDCCLCHGCAGLGHLYGRMYQMSQDGQLGEAARHWFRETLKRRVPGKGIGGYAAVGLTDRGDPCELHEPGFLRGGAGIGLALMGAATDHPPAWDRALLLS